jgi:hypothetical protein
METCSNCVNYEPIQSQCWGAPQRPAIGSSTMYCELYDRNIPRQLPLPFKKFNAVKYGKEAVPVQMLLPL